MTGPVLPDRWRRELSRWPAAARRLQRLPGGPASLLSGAALVISIVALVVALTDGAHAQAGAIGPVGPTIPAGPAADPTSGQPGPEPSPPAATPSTGPVPTAPAGPAPAGAAPAALDCAPATVTVADAYSLDLALVEAQPGTSIWLLDGVYEGEFVASTPGTAERPVFLCGGPGAILDGGGIKGGYALHLDGASHWHVAGFTVRNAQKGVMADGVSRTVISGLTVEHIGDEAIHLRVFSSDNVVEDNVVRQTGLRKERYGEGVYIGTAESNWCAVTDCEPDRSDRNTVRGNDISGTTAEPVDIKEGTTGGTVAGNTFDGADLTGRHADSWVDVKGNGWTIRDNTGRNSREDGFQTHEVVDGWGRDNVFMGNTADVNGPGWGFHFTPTGDNRVTCDNRVTGAAEGFANVACS